MWLLILKHTAEDGGSDADAEKEGERTLFRLSDASGKMEFTQVGKGMKFPKKSLDSNDVFILDAGDEVYLL